ncbi:MAG: hypothetical protein E7484_03140 [Ruminococcaceae bacterium]|nr:hypothetical protein [Oscillospiraceae bacterium]
MKLKANREKQTVIGALKDIYSTENEAVQTAISIDVNGCINIDSFKKLIDYRQNSIVIETRQKRVYIYGEDLIILSCSKHNAVCNGKITKIELFENEV